MKRAAALFFTMVLGSLAADDPVVFKSDVAMTRVDAQVVDLTGRPIPGLRAGDFVLRVDGKPQPIRNFATESMPIDVLLLLDVSGSMQPHIQRIADASESALRVLAPADRIAIMLFDTHTRVRLSFRSDHGGVSEELHSLIRSERFDGGTHITHALLDAAHYVQREGRPNARRAIVILTDDETQDAQDAPQVEQALDEANAVLSFLRAPYDEQFVQGRRVPSSSGPWGESGPIGGGGTWGGGVEPHGRAAALGQGEVPAYPVGSELEAWTRRIPPERPISPKTREEMLWKSIAPLLFKRPWRDCGSAMRCTFIGRRAPRTLSSV
ncbi:MAG: VWA domain-containing protein [Bryobacteraceae bacterium]